MTNKVEIPFVQGPHFTVAQSWSLIGAVLMTILILSIFI